MDSNLLKTKSIEALVDDVEKGKHLKRTLTAFDLTLLGIGAIIGTGIFVLTGTAAANQAGPAITLSYVIGRARLRLRGALLRGVRRDDPDLGQRLRLRLRHPRRDHRLDDRLGPHPRVRGRVDDRVDRLERLLPEHPRRLRLAPARLDVRRPRHDARRRRQPPRHPDRAPDHRPAGGRHPRERALQRDHGGDQAGRGRLLHRRPASSSSSPRTGRPSRPTAGRGSWPRRPSSSSPTSASTPSRPPPRRPRTPAATCPSASSPRSSSAPSSTSWWRPSSPGSCRSPYYRSVEAALPGTADRAARREHRVPQRAGGLRAARNRPGLGARASSPPARWPASPACSS